MTRFNCYDNGQVVQYLESEEMERQEVHVINIFYVILMEAANLSATYLGLQVMVENEEPVTKDLFVWVMDHAVILVRKWKTELLPKL